MPKKKIITEEEFKEFLDVADDINKSELQLEQILGETAGLEKSAVKPLNDGNKIERNPDGTLKKGAILNPAGKPPGTKHLSTLLRDTLKEMAKDKYGKELGMSLEKIIVQAAIKKAASGDIRAIEHIWDRLEGKAPQTLNLESEGKDVHGIIITDLTDKK